MTPDIKMATWYNVTSQHRAAITYSGSRTTELFRLLYNERRKAMYSSTSPGNMPEKRTYLAESINIHPTTDIQNTQKKDQLTTSLSQLAPF